MGKLQFTPSAAIDGFYKVVNTVQAKIISTRIGDVDLSTISLEDADKLFANGTDYLEQVKPKKATKKNV